jgi:hypothetical protein
VSRGFVLSRTPICQTFDPKKRLTADEALEHPYLSAYVRPFWLSRRRHALNGTPEA